MVSDGTTRFHQNKKKKMRTETRLDFGKNANDNK